ncbi:glycosyl hydrolase family protein [Lichenibacterium minor]|uniref:Glycosyl hydrolase family protein n=1 Tax=Lichenibacterium minor TaxID=2316528 RepID=A0A4Q2UBV4_9HYPH|nr:carbohydrate-binding domain-containing protein [Lichenibacterium minor]RYC32345.1 glycosyl hydrolase family protein [Lichenibacterium minor]
MVDLTGYKMTFDDEFNARSISQSGTGTTWSDIRPQWRYDAESDIGFGKSSFVDAGSGYDPFNVAGGALSITAVPDRTASGYPGSWESGLISTKGTFSQTYGYFEMRAQTASAPGSWDAFWMLPDKPTANQELDVMEHYGNNNPGTYSTIHTSDNTPASALQVYSQDASRTTGYHTYGMDWEPDRITFYVDGKAMGSQATPSDMHSPMYLLADLATESNAAGGSMTTKIDYIRAFSKDPAAKAVTQGTVSAPDANDPGLYGASTANVTAAATSTATASSGPTSTTVGSGSDKLVLSMSEDAYKGDAQYTVSVDGQQVGGTQTAHAAHGTATDTLNLLGDWAAGSHMVSVNFLNDLYGGSTATDRNLYVNGATYDGAGVSGAQNSLMSTGAKTFVFQDLSPTTTTTATTTTATTTATTTTATASSGPTSTTVGSGSDKLVLSMSEDAYKGDAQYTVSVDGQQVGGTQTAHAAHGTATDTLNLLGDWAAGSHMVSVNFLNDLYGGSTAADRNLYINGATYDGAGVSGAQNSLMSTGAKTFVFQDVSSTTTTTATSTATASSGPTSTTLGSGSDKLVLSMSEDAYKGDAQYTVSVDGQQVGGTQTAHAAHGTATDTLNLLGDWAAGSHMVSVNFLNDLYGGSTAADRNLYINGATYNGTFVGDSQHSLMSSGPQNFTFHAG